MPKKSASAPVAVAPKVDPKDLKDPPRRPRVVEVAKTKPPRESSPAAEWVPIELLAPWIKNPRLNDEATKQVAESIKQFGFGAPIVARRENNEVIAGHTRLKAAKLLKMKTVPVRFLDLTEEQAHMLALADNKLAEIAEWDKLGLRDVLTELGEQNSAFAGFDADEFRKLVLGDAAPDDFPEIDADAVTEHQCPKCGYEWSGQAKRRAE